MNFNTWRRNYQCFERTTTYTRSDIIGILFLAVFLTILITEAYAKDAMYDDFKDRINNFKIEIIKKSSDLKRAYLRSASSGQIGGKGEKDAEKEYEALGKEITSLKTEMTKHYKGKVPKQLASDMLDVQMSYSEKQTEAYDYYINLLKK